MIDILTTKLYIPRPRPNLVPRPRLTERLNAGLDKKLTLIAAPAGFGKTSLLSEWIPRSPRCITWLSLDDGDNDPTRFWTYVIASMRGIHPDLGQSALALLQSPQAPPITSFLAALINDISAFPDAFCSVLDDYHLIDSQPIHEAIAYLIDHLPDNLHLILSTRADPPLPLARLRARDHMNEVRARELRFTTDEAAAFLDRQMGRSLSDDDVVALRARTEGWIAGLQIAALSMQDHDDVPDYIRAFSGSHRHILGYLAEEVIERRPKGTLDFLLQTSILDGLCGPLCDAITGSSDGQEKLEKLERANLFISPLDDDARWYRYHQLFADVLRTRLRRTWPDRVPELHRRAGKWYADNGMLEEAVRHLLEAADFDEAANLVESAAGAMLRRGSIVSLMRWLDALPETTIRARPGLCLNRARTLQMGPVLDLDLADKWAELALQAASASVPIDADLAGEVAALQAMIAVTRGEVERGRELAMRAQAQLRDDNPWRSAAAFCLGTAHQDSGHLAAAADAFREAMRLGQADNTHYIQLAAASFLGDIEISQGRLGLAMETYQQVLAWSDPDLPQKGSVMALAGQAAILCERNELEAALALIRRGTEQAHQVGGAWSVHVISRVVARVGRAQGNWSEAFDALDQAFHLGQQGRVSIVETEAAALRALLELERGDLEAAFRWAAKTGLDPDDPAAARPGMREVEYLTYVRVLDEQGMAGEALSLLDRMLPPAEAEGRYGSAIRIRALKCHILQDLGRSGEALACLERALVLAEPEGYVRTFLEEGDSLRSLLTTWRLGVNGRVDLDTHQSRLVAYADRLLAAFPQPRLQPSTSNAQLRSGHLLEPLREREFQVLDLISRGYTNQEIADELVLGLSTIKTHINNLFRKLDVANRTQAVARARSLDLLED